MSKSKCQIKPQSFHFQWHITERCNLRCKHCYLNSKFIKEELPYRDLLKIFKKYIAQVKIWGLNRNKARITFMGGEPFVRKDFFDLLQEAYSYRQTTKYGLSTNGILINQDIAQKLKALKVDYVQVSLEGREKINDFIRGRGVFKKAVKALKTLTKAGLETSISMTVTRINIKEVPYVIKLTENLGVDGIGIRRFVPIGGGRQIKKFLLNPLEIKKLYLSLLTVRAKAKIGISLGCEDGILAQEPLYFPKGCSAGYLSFTVLPNGDIYPCRRLPIYSGNLLKQSFKEIYNSKVFQKLRDVNNINNTCKNCPYFAYCRGGAKCQSYAYFGNPFAPDYQCWRIFENLPNTSQLIHART